MSVVIAEEHDGSEEQQNGWLGVWADVGLAPEGAGVDLEAPQNKEDEPEEDLEAPQEIEEAEEVPQDCEEASKAPPSFEKGGKAEGYFDDGQVTPQACQEGIETPWEVGEGDEASQEFGKGGVMVADERTAIGSGKPQTQFDINPLLKLIRAILKPKFLKMHLCQFFE